MTDLEIRPMTAADVEAAAAVYRAGGWGERRDMLEWVLANPTIRPLVGLADGAVVATAMATINGPVGWVGSIFVDAALRSRGYGRAMTAAACELIDAAACRTQILIASTYGRPLYDKMGFRLDEEYQVLEAPPLDPLAAGATPPPPGTRLRRMRPEDLGGVFALDRRATGEDRSAIIGTLLSSGWVLERGVEPRGYLASIHPDCGAVVALDIEAAACLLDRLRLDAAGRAGSIRAVVPAGHESGWRGLEQLGWTRAFRTPRMLRGDPVDWDPTLIWGVLSFGFG